MNGKCRGGKLAVDEGGQLPKNVRLLAEIDLETLRRLKGEMVVPVEVSIVEVSIVEGSTVDADERRWRWKRARGLCTWPAEVDQRLPLMGTS